MTNVKQILVVDDHFEMLEFLRSMLELSNQECEVLAVPSAEEGLLELRRAPFDLLITDVRLPGMSGFDLVRRVKALGRQIPVIMITAYSSPQGRKEATDLGVYRYFQKPLDTDNVLAAVHKALHGAPVPLLEPSVNEPVLSQKYLSDEVRKRLETLRADTGAIRLMLTTVPGRILFEVGSGRQLDLPTLATLIARNLSDSFLLARQLGSENPFTLQYHAGEKIELYCANVGRSHFLTIFFDAASRRGRIGTIWLFTQRAIKDLLEMLPALAVIEELGPSETRPVPAVLADKQDDKPLPGPNEPSILAGEVAAGEDDGDDVAVTLAETAERPTGEEGELADLLALELGDGGPIDLDAFWENALAQDESPTAAGLSWEEAWRRGLISSKLDPDEDAE